MTTHVITLWRVDITSLTTFVSTMRFLLEELFILKAIKSKFIGPCDKQNLTLVVIHMKFMKLAIEQSDDSHHCFPWVGGRVVRWCCLN